MKTNNYIILLKKTFLGIITFILLFVFLASCTVSNELQGATENNNPSEEAVSETREALAGRILSDFNIDVTLDTENHKLIVSEIIDYYNNTGVQLKEMYFNIIPGAFENYGGGIDVNTVTLDAENAEIRQVEGSVYVVDLLQPLEKDASLIVRLEYEVLIPNTKNRFGYQDDVYNLGNFIATPSVYDENGWSMKPYVDVGDAFYSDISNYYVNISVPSGYTIAASGTKIEEGKYVAEKVRDFVFCASNSYQLLTEKVNEKTINLYYGENRGETAQRIMETSKKSLSLLSELLGDYPYDTLTIVLNGLTGGVGGMEYPTFFMVEPRIAIDDFAELGIGDNLEEQNIQLMFMDRIAFHEIAHQWFYGIVGSDQILYPWLDEGICRFLELFFERAYPPDVPYDSGYSLDLFFNDRYSMIESNSNKYREYMKWTLYDWEKRGSMDYGEMYLLGASMFYKMMQDMGEENFKKSLKGYVDCFAYSIVTPESFMSYWNNKYDFSKLFHTYFNR